MTYYYLFTDHLGSTVLMGSQNSAKNQLEAVTGSRATYYPFGDYRGLPPTQTLTDRGFTGQKSNNQPGADLGLLYYNARYYAPGIARFISADTIVPDPANPQAFNRYAYTLNNPTKFVDLSGHCASENVDSDCWQQYDDLFNQFRLNNYSDEHILELIGNGESYRYYKMGIIQLYDSYRNCNGDVTCSNHTSQPANDPYTNPCSWQYWEDCYEPVIKLHGPDAIVAGGSGSAAGIWYVTAGEEVMLNIQDGLNTHDGLSIFSYAGQGSGIAFGTDVFGYFGPVWNVTENSDYEGLTSNLTLDLTLLYGIQINLFWSTGTTPFTGHPWGITIGQSGGGSLGITGSQTNYTCNFGCQ